VAGQILLVDDEVAICQAFQEFLASQGHDVTYATNGTEALAQAAAAELVICDLMLGDENGLQVIEQLKAVRPDLKVLMFTAYPTIDALQGAMDLGVAAFLPKPVALPDLLTNVDRLLGEELGHVMLFPVALRDRLSAMVAFLPEVTVIEPHDWLRARAQLRAAAPSCILVDGVLPETAEFLEACKREIEDTVVFGLFRDDDLQAARRLLSRFPSVKCITIDHQPEEVLRRIRAEVVTRRRECARARTALVQQLSRCDYAEPLRTGYYCTITGPCLMGEEKEWLVTVRGKDYHRCPRRPFVIPNPDRVGLVAWVGVPDEDVIVGYRVEALEQVRRGKTHVVVNCQALDALHFNLIEVLGDVEHVLTGRPDARVDVVNLSPRLLPAFQKAGEFLVNVKFHGRVLMEMGKTAASLAGGPSLSPARHP
jgi:CheY-like chemotaxis protein